MGEEDHERLIESLLRRSSSSLPGNRIPEKIDFLPILFIRKKESKVYSQRSLICFWELWHSVINDTRGVDNGVPQLP